MPVKSFHRLLLSVALLGPVCLLAQLKSPAEFLPHPYQKQFSPHHLIVEYFEHVAEHSARVQIQEIGRTPEHRPMILAFVSASENISSLEAIRQNNLGLTGLTTTAGSTEQAKAIVWLSFSIHGNEASGAEASMQVLYDLVSNQNNAHAWLQNTIVIMEPVVNPDGFNRFANWNTQVSSSPYNISGDAREHHEPWPGGRVNHYLFDLNRDWAWQTQIESQNRMREYQRWMPHVLADLHEMGYTSPYYFAPAAQPYHEFITEWQSEFQTTVGKNHAKYFDREGWTYYTKEHFDLFYPSYGDSYPIFNGAIGMTYEQGGQSYAGRAITLPNGDTLTLSDRVAHHVTTSLSTVEVTSHNAARVITEFAAFFKNAVEKPSGQYLSYLIKGGNSKGRINALCRFLDLQGIKYGYAAPGRSRAAFDYATGMELEIDIEKTDIVISAHQPKGLLTQVLFDPESTLTDSLTYDITCWSLPFAYGLEAYALKEKINVTPMEMEKSAKPTIALPHDAYAYAMRWNSLDDGKLLAAALREGLHPRFATTPFTVGGKDFSPGTVVFMRTDHRKVDDFPEKLLELSNDHGINLEAIKTGFVDKGKDFGSSAYELIEQPTVITLAGDHVSANEIGQVWHFFEQVLDYPLTVVDIDDLSSVQWSDYNTLILPDGYYSLPESVMKSIQSWVSDGGKVIAIGSALSQFRDKEGFALKRFAESDKADEVKKAEERENLNLRLESHESGDRRDISNQISGAVFKAKVDKTHPLGFGLGEYYFTLKTDAASYEHLLDASNVVYLEDELTYYGFAGAKALEKQKNSVIFAVENKGSGSIVYMVDNPLFRAFWENGKFAFCNSLFFVGS